MTLGPAFGAPPPSDFNEPHDLHHEPAPVDPDADRRTTEPEAQTPGSDATPDASPSSGEKKGGIRGWLSRLGRAG